MCDEALRAGLRIRTAGALVDATPDGLLCDAMNVRGMLLAEMNAGRDSSSVERPERVQQRWNPVLRPETRQNKDTGRDDDSKIRHPALGAQP
jgi:hypothetical protein